MSANKAKRVIRLKQVMEMTGLGKSTIYKMKVNGDFPQAFSLGERAVGWWEHEVFGWIEKRAAIRNSFAGVNYADA